MSISHPNLRTPFDHSRSPERKGDFAVFLVVLSSVTLVQFSGGKLFAYSLVWVFIAMCFARVILIGRISRYLLANLILGFAFLIYQIRPSVFFEGGGDMDFIALLPLIMVFAVYGSAPLVERSRFHLVIAYLSLFLVAANIVFYFTSHYPPFFVSEPYAGTRWVGGMDGPNEFAQFYISVLAIFFGLYLERRVSGLALLLALLVISFSVFSTFSRGGFVVLGVLGFLFLIVSMRSILFLLLATPILLSFIFYGGGVYFDAMVQQFSDTRVRATNRDDLIATFFELFFERPILGGGFGSYNVSPLTVNSSPHSDYLYFLTSGGIVAGVVLVLVSFWIVLLFWRRSMFVEFFFMTSVLLNGVFWNPLIRMRLSVLIFFILLIGLNYALAARRKNGLISS